MTLVRIYLAAAFSPCSAGVRLQFVSFAVYKISTRKNCIVQALALGEFHPWPPSRMKVVQTSRSNLITMTSNNLPKSLTVLALSSLLDKQGPCDPLSQYLVQSTTEDPWNALQKVVQPITGTRPALRLAKPKFTGCDGSSTRAEHGSVSDGGAA
jgi:hypothetical protein